MTTDYELVVGLEVHAELATKTKIFCSCPVTFGTEPNTVCCPVCMGLPGALPTLNKAVVDYAIRAGLATGCEIARYSRMARKNYFYPDLPKAYQISQYNEPLCFGGALTIDTEGGEKRIGITRIHIEEDAGKLIHDKTDGTLLDANRCGIPLIEIVSEPDIRSAAEAKAYLQALRTILLYTGVSDCRMNEGSFRCDINLSIRKRGESTLGTRTELKNLNSFSFAVKAIEAEFCRQVTVLEAGGQIRQETLRFDPSTGKTIPMRSKENAQDYRYFPDPDLPPFCVTEEQIERNRLALPRLPRQRQRQYREQYGIPQTEAALLTSDRAMAEYFEAAAEQTAYPRTLANLILSELLRYQSTDRFTCPISPEHLAAVADLSGSGMVGSSNVKKLLGQLWEQDDDPKRLAEEQKLMQISDPALLLPIVRAALADCARSVTDYRNGKSAAAKAILGRIMALSSGRADPRLAAELLEQELNHDMS